MSLSGEASYVHRLRATCKGSKPHYEPGDFVTIRLGPTYPGQLVLIVGDASLPAGDYRGLIFQTGRARFTSERIIQAKCVAGLSAETDTLTRARVAANASAAVQASLARASAAKPTKEPSHEKAG